MPRVTRSAPWPPRATAGSSSDHHAAAQEDDKVRELVTLHGPKKWSLIASNLPGRIGKQCRER